MAKRWYVIHTYSGYEQRVKDDLMRRREIMDLEDSILDIRIPTEEVTELKEGGERVTKTKKLMPGYVLIRMEMNDHTWSIIRNTPGVSGFVGGGGKPEPLARHEFEKIMKRTDKSPEEPRVTTTDLKVGQNVKVVNGPLADFEGVVSEVDVSTGKIKVMVSIFGRETPVELSFDQVASL